MCPIPKTQLYSVCIGWGLHGGVSLLQLAEEKGCSTLPSSGALICVQASQHCPLKNVWHHSWLASIASIELHSVCSYTESLLYVFILSFPYFSLDFPMWLLGWEVGANLQPMESPKFAALVALFGCSNCCSAGHDLVHACALLWWILIAFL